MRRLCIDCGAFTQGTRCLGCTRREGRRRAAARDPGAAAVYGSTAWQHLARAVVAGATSCYWCGRMGVRLSADHVLGVRRHPDHALDPSNVVPACASCQNRRRGDA